MPHFDINNNNNILPFPGTNGWQPVPDIMAQFDTTPPTTVPKMIKDHYALGDWNKKFKPKEFICGCEFEIESVKDWNPQVGVVFHIENDHSLRNSGKEFKTKPSTFDQAIDAFKLLHSNLSLGKDPFSERTSIHVHVNVRDLSLKEVRRFILVYALLEPLFFEFVGEKRKGSIYCVPLSYTYLPSLYKKSVPELLDKWNNNKYTAFNILPIRNFGTVEFRHLYGTNDQATFYTWLSAIKELYEYVLNVQPEIDIVDILSSGEYVSNIAKVAVPSLANKMSSSHIEYITKDSLIDVKLSRGGLR